MSWEDWKHAFATSTRTAAEPTPEETALVERLCREIRRRRLTPAALVAFEMARPLSYLGAQGLHFCEPLATAIFSAKDYRCFARFLERRDACERIVNELQHSDSIPDENPESPPQKNEASETGERLVD